MNISSISETRYIFSNHQKISLQISNVRLLPKKVALKIILAFSLLSDILINQRQSQWATLTTLMADVQFRIIRILFVI